ncbi:MAG: cell division protein ZapB [Treponema sp.]|jgi:FtsZ-binding cell division protein ZapB|nr:cell division protein ZapB [Treponema sp.]
MVTLEQIKLLESKITRAIDVVTRLSEENLRLKKRNGELEDLAEKLKNEKTRIEEGIVSALDRLNQFEDAIERSLDSVKSVKPQDAGPSPQRPAAPESRPSAALPKPAVEQQPARPTAPAQPERPEPAPIPQAYLVDEEEAENAEDEDTGEAELDIF